jgi:hypothetical protein
VPHRSTPMEPGRGQVAEQHVNQAQCGTEQQAQGSEHIALVNRA